MCGFLSQMRQTQDQQNQQDPNTGYFGNVRPETSENTNQQSNLTPGNTAYTRVKNTLSHLDPTFTPTPTLRLHV